MSEQRVDSDVDVREPGAAADAAHEDEVRDVAVLGYN